MKDEDNPPKLPKNWVWTKLMDACQYLSTGVDEFEGEIEYYSTGSIKGDSHTPQGKYSFSERPSRANRMAEKEDVLQARMRGTNKALLIDKKLDGKLFSTGFIQLRPFERGSSMSSYLYYYVQSPSFLKQRDNLATGTTQVALTDSAAQDIDLPLAPLTDQHRIVSKIEELFTKLGAGVEALKRVKVQLERHCQAVLKHAFEGELTEEWRKSQKISKTGKEVLELANEKPEFNKYKTQGKMLDINNSLLYDLPETWTWGQVGDVCEKIRYGTSEKAKKEYTGTPVLRMGNIQDGRLKFDDLKFMPDDWNREELMLKAGDVLFNRTNSAELVGKTAVYKEQHPDCTFASYLVRARLFRDIYIPELLCAYVNSYYGKKYVSSVISQQVGQANVNATKFASIPLPVPPLGEQRRISEEVDQRLSIVEKGKNMIRKNLKRAERLRQSILKKAFEGELVLQNRDDESAEKLLKRIKTEKEKREAEKKKFKAKGG